MWQYICKIITDVISISVFKKSALKTIIVKMWETNISLSDIDF
jgi:hypothetical protein